MECEEIGLSLLSHFPSYLAIAYLYRSRCHGLARVWSTDGESARVQISQTITDYPSKTIADRIVSQSCGGIVIYKTDINLIIAMLGFVTDIGLKPHKE